MRADPCQQIEMWRAYKGVQIYCTRICRDSIQKVYKNMQGEYSESVQEYAGIVFRKCTRICRDSIQKVCKNMQMSTKAGLNSIIVLTWTVYIHTHSNTFQRTLQTRSNLTGNVPPNLADAIKYALKASHTNISQRFLNAGKAASWLK